MEKSSDIRDVQLKIVGEDLSIIKVYKQPLVLKFSCMGSGCEVSFHDGMLHFNSCLHDLAS